MAWGILDKGTADHDLQTILFSEDLKVLVAGLQGVDCVLSGLAVTGGADMTPAVAKGAVLSNGVLFAVAGADVTIGTADATNPRLDLIVVNSAGALAVRAGTAAANPKPPARSANDVVIARVYVPATDTSIETTKVTDLRVFPPTPLIIHKVTTARTVNNSTAANSIWATPPVLPSGLFLAGKVLEVEAGGNMLVNSGTPTLRLEVLYGGTTMFSFISAAGVADADRSAWHLRFKLVAQANNDQAMAGHFELNDLVAARPTPTAGVGSWQTNTATAEGPCAIGGSAAVDSDAADRTLDVRFTFSVANAANEFVVEYATVTMIGPLG
jgi:hypothetical protein